MTRKSGGFYCKWRSCLDGMDVQPDVGLPSWYIQYNLNGLNTDGSFTMDDSNSFFSPYKILSIAQENKYLGIFSYFIMELYVVCTH